MEKKKAASRLRNKYRLTIYNDATYAEVWQMRLSRLNVLTFVSVVALLGVAVVVALIAFTPLREFIPGYPDSRTRRYIVQNAQRLDSIEQQVRRWTLYNDNVNRILMGQEPINIEGVSDTALTQRFRALALAHSVEDSLFRKQVEEVEQFNLSLSSNSETASSSTSLHFYPPLRGKLKARFSTQEQRYGVSIAAMPGSVVMATLDGVVMSASWTLESGYIVVIQHGFNMVSIYKNCGQLLKRKGMHVNAGEAIAIMGSDGRFDTFEFELWNNGTPVNPEQHIVF
jgi:murein DD-endopeptidase MepM/ murein hydrolase activator NlpD